MADHRRRADNRALVEIAPNGPIPCSTEESPPAAVSEDEQRHPDLGPQLIHYNHSLRPNAASLRPNAAGAPPLQQQMTAMPLPQRPPETPFAYGGYNQTFPVKLHHMLHELEKQQEGQSSKEDDSL
jgi:hypothetical protein